MKLPTIAAVVLGSGALIAYFQQSQPTTPPPPVELYSNGVSDAWDSDDNLRATLNYQTKERKVTVGWTHVLSGASEKDFISTAYYPTSAVKLHSPPNTFCVAGRTKFGRTVVEIFNFVPPTVVSAGGTTTVGHMTVSSIESVYDEKTDGRDMVFRLHQSLFDETCLTLQFWDSRDLYYLDTVSGVVTKLASPTGSGAIAVTAAEFSSPQSVAWSGDHPAFVMCMSSSIRGSLKLTSSSFTMKIETGLSNQFRRYHTINGAPRECRVKMCF